MNVCTYVHMYVRDPVRLRLRHLYQVEFCSFIVRYPTAGASVYCDTFLVFTPVVVLATGLQVSTCLYTVDSRYLDFAYLE